MLDKEDIKWLIQRYIDKEGIVFANGCEQRKCPCRLWTQCGKYVDIEEQQRRLKRKVDEDYKIINLWYDQNFRIVYEHGDSLGNG